jgi:hypothetical protein
VSIETTSTSSLLSNTSIMPKALALHQPHKQEVRKGPISDILVKSSSKSKIFGPRHTATSTKQQIKQLPLFQGLLF